VITLLINRAAVILAEQNGQIQCTMDWYFWGKTGKCPFTCCLFSSVIMQFCVTQKFLIQTGLSSQRISSTKWVTVMVVMAVDYPILCGPCTNINILLFNCYKNNVNTCHLLFVLECRWSQSLWQMYSYEKSVSGKCASWKKWYWKFGTIHTKSTILC